MVILGKITTPVWPEERVTWDKLRDWEDGRGQVLRSTATQLDLLQLAAFEQLEISDKVLQTLLCFQSRPGSNPMFIKMFNEVPDISVKTAIIASATKLVEKLNKKKWNYTKIEWNVVWMVVGTFVSYNWVWDHLETFNTMRSILGDKDFLVLHKQLMTIEGFSKSKVGWFLLSYTTNLKLEEIILRLEAEKRV